MTLLAAVISGGVACAVFRDVLVVPFVSSLAVLLLVGFTFMISMDRIILVVSVISLGTVSAVVVSSVDVVKSIVILAAGVVVCPTVFVFCFVKTVLVFTSAVVDSDRVLAVFVFSVLLGSSIVVFATRLLVDTVVFVSGVDGALDVVACVVDKVLIVTTLEFEVMTTGIIVVDCSSISVVSLIILPGKGVVMESFDSVVIVSVLLLVTSDIIGVESTVLSSSPLVVCLSFVVVKAEIFFDALDCVVFG